MEEVNAIQHGRTNNALFLYPNKNKNLPQPKSFIKWQATAGKGVGKQPYFHLYCLMNYKSSILAAATTATQYQG